MMTSKDIALMMEAIAPLVQQESERAGQSARVDAADELREFARELVKGLSELETA